MIDWTNTNHVFSEERPVGNNYVTTIQEGMAAESFIENGIVKLRPSQGTSSGRLEGVLLCPRKPYTNNITGVQVTVPVGGGTVLLPNTVTGSIGAFNSVNGASVAVSTSAASSSNIQSGTDSATGLTSLTFDSTGASQGGGTVLNVFYQYAMSTQDSVTRYGTQYPGFAPSDVLYQTGLFRIGRIFVNNFSQTADWYGSNNAQVKVLSGGIFSASNDPGTGYNPINVDVIQLPTPAYPWLGLSIH